MVLSKLQLVILKTELDTDPNALGYTSDDPETAALMNEVRSGEDYQIANTSIPASEIMDAVVSNELGNIHTNELLFFLERIRGSGRIDVSDGSAFQTQIGQTFSVADAPNTRAGMLLLKSRDGSRAEILFGAGITITHLDVGTARLI